MSKYEINNMSISEEPQASISNGSMSSPFTTQRTDLYDFP